MLPRAGMMALFILLWYQPSVTVDHGIIASLSHSLFISSISFHVVHSVIVV